LRRNSGPLDETGRHLPSLRCPVERSSESAEEAFEEAFGVKKPLVSVLFSLKTKLTPINFQAMT
jgi:hypothetical protein